jgi:Dynamin family
VVTSFNRQFDQHALWRRDFALRLKALGDWMKDNELLDAAVEDRLRQLEAQMRADKLMVAFVAEFSRGKSELINAIFFAGYGRRIMPASAGRTTMCPTELGYDAQVPPSLRLLPIETRLQSESLMAWRGVPDQWTHIDLDLDDAAQLAGAMEKVAQTRHVTLNEARALGFWHDESPGDNPPLDAEGRVEVPRWRHALLNMPHPLLKQGLVVLDTPGLNAVGAEPELTVSLIPQAQAMLFILAADTGVTQSDLTIWREHLATESRNPSARIVVLNKIDTLWDALSTPGQVQAQIQRQCQTTAETLGVLREQVMAVSAQKGLLAKIQDDADLLAASQLPQLEQVLSEGLLGQRQAILNAAIESSVAQLRAEAERIIHVRRRDLTEQLLEIQGLRGKNATVIRQMLLRVENEKAEFEAGSARIQAIRAVHTKLLSEAFKLLGHNGLREEMKQLAVTLRQPGIKLGVKKAYTETFQRLHDTFTRVRTVNDEILSMLTSSYRELNAEHGFSLQPPAAPDLAPFSQDLEVVRRSHVQYLGVNNVLKLAQPQFTERLVRALSTRVRSVFEMALGEIEHWSKSCTAQLDTQWRERRSHFRRRIDAIERIQQAAGGLDERIAELTDRERSLTQLRLRLQELTSRVASTSPPRRLQPVAEEALRA